MTTPPPTLPATARRKSRRPERPVQKIRRNVVAALARFGIDAIGRLPYRVAGGLGATFGVLGYYLNRRESIRAVAHPVGGPVNRALR